MEWDDCSIVIAHLLLLRDSMAASFATSDSGPPAGWRERLSRAGDSPWFFPVVLAATVAVLFFDCVGADCIFAFRDSLHFYPPLYRLTADEWLAGRVPLWNPLLNCGQPLAGMGTAGAFYVPQIVLTMLLPDGVSLNVYCILHLAFAVSGAYLVARHQGCSRPAATMAGLVYSFSGSVLLQIYNPVFAAGAAWLAWAVLGGMKLLDGGGICDFLLLAAGLAMSVFAGDPQAAYHAGLVLGVWWLMQPARSWRRLGLLTAAGAAGGVLCLVQVALAAEFARESTRAVDLVPFSLWDVPRFLARPAAARAGVAWYDVLIGRPPPGADHYHAMYRFPVEAYRLGELFWPGMSGPTVARWTVQAGLARPDWWTASIYCGMFSVPAAVAACTTMPLARQCGAWIIVAMLAMAASCGQIGPAAIVRWGRELFSGEGLSLVYRSGDEVGGLYWLLASVLPGYAGFRYPAKWMTVAMLAVGQVAAKTADGLGDESLRRRIRRACLGVVGVEAVITVVLVLAAAWLGAGHVLPWPTPTPGRDIAFWRVVTGGLHGIMVAASIAAVVSRWVPRWSAAALLLVVAADLALAGRADLLVVPWSSVIDASSYLEGMQAGRRPDMAEGISRIRIRKSAELSSSSPMAGDPPSNMDLLRDGVRQIGLMGSGHLPWLHGCELIGDPSTAMYRDMDALRVSRHRGEETIVPRRYLDSAGVEYFMTLNAREDTDNSASVLNDWSAAQRSGEFTGDVPAGDLMPSLGVPLDRPADAAPLALVCRNESALPRARIVRDVATVSPVEPADRDRWLGLLERVAFPTPDMPDLRRAAIVEIVADAGPPYPTGGSGIDKPTADSCRVIVDEPQRVVVQAELSAPGLLYLADTFHRDWRAVVASEGQQPRDAAVLRANQVHRGVGLAAGRHLVEFRYASQTFARTAPLTAVAWGVAAVALGWSLRRRGMAGPGEHTL